MTEAAELTSKIRIQTKQLLGSLCQGLYEREEAIQLALLSAVAGESIFLLGPPGVGKSLIARRLKYAFKDGKSFEYLMSKFSTPDEIFGPVSIKKLKEEDKYERITDRYMPGANIVFLDEIWKAGPAIQNALLTILNEKIYRNGDEDLKVDIKGIITASNELPPQNSSLAPIWDRFLIRMELGNIKEFGNFIDMITDTSNVYADDVSDDHKLSNELLDQWDGEIDKVTLPAEVLNTVQVVKIKIDEHNARLAGSGYPIVIHDRRWKKIIRLMRTSAFLNGRKAVDLMDCFLMAHCLWNTPGNRDKVKDIITESIRQHGYTMAVNLQMVKQEVADFTEDVEREIHIKHTISEEQLMPIDDEYFELKISDSKFEGCYVTIKDYRKLSIGEKQVTNFFDKDKNLVNRINAEKGKEANTLVIHRDAKEQIYHLRTRLSNREEAIPKAPHPIIQKHWDERHQKLVTFVSAQLAKIAGDKPGEIQLLDHNLFVHADYAEVVKSNLEEVTVALQQMQLKLEKIQYAYTNI